MKATEFWIACDPRPTSEMADVCFRAATRIDHKEGVRLDLVLIGAERNAMLNERWTFYCGDSAEAEARADAQVRLAARDAVREVPS